MSWVMIGGKRIWECGCGETHLQLTHLGWKLGINEEGYDHQAYICVKCGAVA